MSKKNPNKIPITMADVKRYQKMLDEEWERKHEELYTKASQRASVWYQAITYLALCNKFGFSTDDLSALQEEMGRISDKIIAQDGKHKNYTIDTVRKELKKYNVEFDMEELEEMES